MEEQRKSSFEKALIEWGHILGNQGILLGEKATQEYGKSTLAISRQVPAALRPKSVDELILLLKVGWRYKIPIYQVTPHGYGLGTVLSADDGCVIIDLVRMNRILKFDEELGLVTIQAGVTRKQLYEYMQHKNASYLVPNNGAFGPHRSVLSNVLARLYSVVPYVDQFGALISLKAVLPSGEVYWSSMPQVFKWGVGPYLDGLFSQGNLGIVTEATISLAPKTQRVEIFCFEINKDKDLEKVVSAICDLINSIGCLISFCRLADPLWSLTSIGRSFSEFSQSSGTFQKLLRGFPAWHGTITLHGCAKLLMAARSILWEKLRPVVSRAVLVKPHVLEKIRNSLPRNRSKKLDEFIGLLSDTPNESGVATFYWKSGIPADHGNLNPDQDGCGYIIYFVLVPAKSERVRDFVNLVRRVRAEYRLDVPICIQKFSDKEFLGFAILFFNPSDHSETSRAHACYEALCNVGKSMGLSPYCPPRHAMNLAVDGSVPFWRLVKKAQVDN